MNLVAETDADISSESSSESEGVFTVTQVLPVTAEEELGAPAETTGEAGFDEEPPLDNDEPHRSYQLKPTVKVNPARIRETTERILNEHLADVKEYDADEMRDSVLKISSAVREELRGMGLDRYRIVCQVSVGEKCDQDIAMSFLCLWSHEFDHYAVATFDDDKFFATAVVFAIYKQ